jgi:type II secretory pathway pseudopilin PulG
MQLDASRTSNRAARRSREETGSTLVEVMIATVILATGVLTMAQLFGVATASNSAARANTFATVLAEQKIEQLRSLTWGFDTQGLPISDFATNTTVTPETPNGGTGLTPSPGNALQSNVVGYVDHLDATGRIVGNQAVPPNTAVYTRRWSVEPLPTNPNNTLVLQVLVSRNRVRGQAEQGNVGRLPDEARVITVKTRKTQ